MDNLERLQSDIQDTLNHRVGSSTLAFGELTLEVEIDHLVEACRVLRDHHAFCFDMLMDLCVVDYLHYGMTEWATTSATKTGFSRGVSVGSQSVWQKPRFAVVYHLLSIKHNQRVRLKTFVSEEYPTAPSVIDIWNSANWYEREAFDLYGIFFEGHPDLRRILTDYGFIGHPFRKDFPLSGHVEMRYSAKDQRVIYEPVSITPRTLVPKIIRDDNRYVDV